MNPCFKSMIRHMLGDDKRMIGLERRGAHIRGHPIARKSEGRARENGMLGEL